MSDTPIPMMGKGIDPWQAYKDYYGAAASQYAPQQAQETIKQTKATTGKTIAETATEQQRPALINAQAGLAGAQAGLAGAQAGKENAQTSYIGGPQTAETYAHAGLLGTQAGKTVAETGLVGAQTKTEYMRPALLGAQTGETGARALKETAGIPLVQAQTTAANIANRIGGMGADVREKQFRAIMRGSAGTPEQQRTLLWNGGAAPDTSGGISGAAPSAPFTSDRGTMAYTEPEFPIPQEAAWRIFNAADQTAAVKAELENRQRALSGLVERSYNPDRTINPALWNQNMKIAFDAGYLNNQQFQQWYNHSEQARNATSSLLPPSETPGPAGLVSGAREAAKTPFEAMTVNVKDAAGNVTPTQMPKDQALKAIRAGTATSNSAVPGFTQMLAPDGQPFQPSPFSLAMNKIENPGGDPAQANTSGPGGTRASSATGNNQFTDETWLEQAKKLYPDASNAELMKLRTSSNLPFAATDTYALQNQEDIQKYYPGEAVPTAAIGLAHLTGAGGFAKFAQADSGSLLRDVLPTAAANNPKLANKTVGEISQIYKDAFANVPPPTMPALGPLPGTKAAQQIGAGVTELSPENSAALATGKARDIAMNAAQIEETRKLSEAYGDRAGAIAQAGFTAPQKLERLQVLENAVQDFRPGATGPMRQAALGRTVDALQMLGLTVPGWMSRGITGAELIGKEGTFLAGEITRILGSREAAAIFDQYAKANPNVSLSTGGFVALVQSIKQGVVREQDMANFQDQWLADPGHKNSITGMQSEFNKTHSPEAYASRIIPMAPPKSWAPKDMKENVIYRLGDGSSRIWSDGALHKLAGQ